MLLQAASLISLIAILGCAASTPDPAPRHVVDVRRPRGLAPRQNIAGVMLDSPNNVPGTGITRLVLASDQRCVPSCYPDASCALNDWLFCSSYYATIAAGNISFRLAVDTGSSDMLITSSDCVSNPCRSVPKYPLKYQSPTFVSLDGNTTTFNVSYADGTCAFTVIASIDP
jgi:hypothetical protein